MSSATNVTNLKYIITILSSVIIGMSVYIVVQKNKKTEDYSTILEKKDNKSLLTDLEFLKDKYNKAISENVNLSDEIFIERDRVEALIGEIKEKNLTIDDYKSKLLDIKSKMIVLFDVNFKLRKTLENKENSIKKEVVTNDNNIKNIYDRNKFLETQNEELKKKVDESSKLTFIEFKAVSYKAKSSGKLIPTENSKKANFLVINYTINKNSLTKPGEKQLYFQIIDPENNVVGETKAITNSESKLLYTFSTPVYYNNEILNLSQQLPFSSFIEGKYKVNIYDMDGWLAETTFDMK